MLGNGVEDLLLAYLLDEEAGQGFHINEVSVLLEERLSSHKLIFTLLSLVVEDSFDVRSAVVIELNVEFGEYHDLVEVEVIV